MYAIVCRGGGKGDNQKSAGKIDKLPVEKAPHLCYTVKKQGNMPPGGPIPPEKGTDIMKYKGAINYIVETHFITEGSNAYDLISDFIYNDIKKELNDGDIFKKSA